MSREVNRKKRPERLMIWGCICYDGIETVTAVHCYFQGVDLTPKKELKKKVQNDSIFGVKFTPVLLTPSEE